MCGITGILRPTGEFISCKYGNHCVIAIDIPKEEDELCIYLSSSIESIGNDENSIIYFCDNVTKEQLIWIMKHIDELDNTQYNMWIKYITNRRIYGE